GLTSTSSGGSGVAVGVGDGVMVAVGVGVLVDVAVAVRVCVGIDIHVRTVAVGVGTGFSGEPPPYARKRASRPASKAPARGTALRRRCWRSALSSTRNSASTGRFGSLA